MVTDIVEIDCFAINSHGQLWTLSLLGAFLLPPDIADCVGATISFAIERTRESGKHIWLLDVESGSHC